MAENLDSKLGELVKSAKELAASATALPSGEVDRRYFEYADRLIEIIAGHAPETVDAALRRLGAAEAREAGRRDVNEDTFPSYPEALNTVIYRAHGSRQDPVIKEAAEVSRHLRIKAFAEGHWTNGKEGSFAAIVFPNPNVPLTTNLFILQRSKNVLGGNGFPGGYLEAEELAAGDYRPKREIAEELAELLANGKEEIVAKRDELLELLRPLERCLQPLASYRDPTTYLETGANQAWTAIAHAHVLVAPPLEDTKAQEHYAQLIETIDTIVTRQRTKGAVPGMDDTAETVGASLVRIGLGELPAELERFRYPHEALGAITGAQVALDRAGAAFDVLGYITDKNPLAIQRIADGLLVQPEDIASHVADIREKARAGELPQPGNHGQLAFTSEQYRAALAAATPDGLDCSASPTVTSQMPIQDRARG